MPTVTRPDGAAIAWREHGSGPPVVLANLGYAPESMMAGLVEELAPDHRVLTYDVRGGGASSRLGPYEIATDAADLVAVVRTAGAEGAVAIGNGDGANRAVRAAAEAPDAIDAAILPGAFTTRAAQGGSEGLSSSASVLKAIVMLLENDYRAGVHSFVSSGNPDLDEDAVSERVELIVAHGSHEATVGRIRSWIADDALDPARSLGDRLWFLHHETNPWFSRTDDFEKLLPEAHHREIADGPMSRPDLTATVVREVTRSGAR